MKKIISILLIIEMILLIQLLLVIAYYFREHPKLVLANFVITLLYSLIIIVILIFKGKALNKRYLFIGMIVLYYTLFFLNLERLVFSNYYVTLLSNQNAFNSALTDSDHTTLINYTNVKAVFKNDDVIYFYFDIDHPTFEGIAYTKTNHIPNHTGQAFQHVYTWGKLYGNWYYWSAYDGY
ncbi:hypothetical protein [Marinifilum caeruleilacunae]|uniref:Uncharacterized protein n=1 Tax=Marinifilum caeruleilacunae TaxID=2499076 RepID=A0ABX1WR00_9BACT|nr:hypothetical protein [Marinifilum caeruleilacunae]NOU58515.1 hypothetical protein [Marinifilum caeruleilacunae]